MAMQKAGQRAVCGAVEKGLQWRAISCLIADDGLGSSQSDVRCGVLDADSSDSSAQLQCRTSRQQTVSSSPNESSSSLDSQVTSSRFPAVPCMQWFRLPFPFVSSSTPNLEPNDFPALSPQAGSLCDGLDLGGQSALARVGHNLVAPFHQPFLQGPLSSTFTSLSSSRGFTSQSTNSSTFSRLSTIHASYSTQAAPQASFPSNIKEFSTSWLTDILRTSGAIGADSAVQSFSSEQVGEGVGLVSALYKLKVTYIGAPGTHAPSGLVAKFAHPSDEARAFAIRNGSYEREARFYQNFGTRPAATPATVNRHKVPIRTPEIYFCEYEPDTARLCILMQDVSDFEPLDQIKGATFDEALGVMQDIGRFHALCWNSPDLDTWRWLPQLHEPRFLAFDPQEYRTAWPRALKLFPGVIPDHLLSPLSQLPDAAPGLLERLGGSPRSLLHGDLRLDNVYIRRGKADADKAAPLAAGVTQEPNLLYIDFGDCCAGRGAHDVGYFLSQSLEPAVRREHEKKLLHAYWGALHGSDAEDVEGMQERLAGYDFEDLVEDYKFGVLYNFCLAVNMASLIEEGKGGERVRQLARTAIERAVKAIEDHNLGELVHKILSSSSQQ